MQSDPSYGLRLASTSPRRRVLLPLLGFPVKPVAVDVDEQARPGEGPLDTATRLATNKASAGGAPAPGEAVVGSDTIVVLDGLQLGKPNDRDDARTMLRALRDRPHQVVSGVAVLSRDGRHSGGVVTTVRMRPYTDSEIEAYLATDRPLDKAGAYAIQDVDFGPVEQVEGCYLNVVGLPLCEVSRGLRTLGWPLPDERLDPPCRLCELGRRVLTAP